MPIVNPAGHIQKYWALGIWYERALMQDAWNRFGGRDLRRIYDVGASVGNHTVWFGASWPAAVVYAFEPHAPSYDVLVEAVKANGMASRTVICPYGLGAHTDRGAVVEVGNEGMNRVVEGDDVSIYALDSLAFRDPDLIKIDVEGMEHEVLTGAHATLLRSHPALYVEGDLARLLEHLAPYGYRHVWSGCSTPTHCFVV
jgi:FkbM family methyltransferase